MGILKFIFKSSLAGGFLYYTVHEGLWSSSEESVAFYGRLYKKTVPYIKENIPKEIADEIPLIPNVTDMGRCAGAMWNKGVKKSINFLINSPTHVSNGVDSLMSTIQNSIGSPKNSNEQPSTKAE